MPESPECPIVSALAAVLGSDCVSAALPDQIAYAADMWPKHHIRKQWGDVCHQQPDAVVFVRDEAQLVRTLEFCDAARVPFIAYGAGSGVCGGTLPVHGGVVADLRGLSAIGPLDEAARTVRCQPGVYGEHLERWLNQRGYTLGHFPSSLWCSTVGGYVATRSAGQYSSRYGKIEDMVVGLRVRLADGREVTGGVSRAPGATSDFDWTPLFVGSEGTLGVVVEATLRVHPLPEERTFRGLRFASVAAGLDAMRRLMQADLRPAVLRLYDPFDTLIALSHRNEDEGTDAPPAFEAAAAAPAPAGPLGALLGDLKRGALGVGLAYPKLLNRLCDALPSGCLLILGFEGARGTARAAMERALHLVTAGGARDAGEGPGRRWYRHRYDISFKQSKVFASGGFVDTMEVATVWSNVEALYRAVRRAVAPHAFIMAHFSHAYRQGCSIYFTFAGAQTTAPAALRRYDRIWDEGLRAVVQAGGTISHHHGIGYSKRGFMAAEQGAGGSVFRALKRVFDPNGVLNPDKLWPSAAGPAAAAPASPAEPLP